MILLKEHLRFSDVDLAGPQAEYVSRIASKSETSIQISVDVFTIPSGKLFLLQTAVSDLIAAASYSARGARYEHQTPEAFTNFYESAGELLGTGSQMWTVPLKTPREVLLPPGVIRVTGFFNGAGATPHQVFVSITGWLVPRASVVI